MLRVPASNHCKLSEEDVDNWYAARDVASVIVSSTPGLTAAIGAPEKTVTAPNLFQVAEYGCDTPAPAVEGQPLRVLWSGSKTHVGDLELIEVACREILRKWTAARVEFIFVGTAPGRFYRDYAHRGCHLEPGVPIAAYPLLLKTVRPDVVLAPLTDEPFNHSKSAIRIYEAWSLTAPVVCSPVGEYAVVEDGVTGLHARTGDEWFAALDRLIADRGLREHLALNGRRRVNDFDWQNPAARRPWRDAVEELRRRL